MLLFFNLHGLYVSLLYSQLQAELITRLKSRTHTQQFQLQDSIRDNIPEVAFNYREYREPLVGVDC